METTGSDSSIVHLLPENESAAHIFQLVRGQVITRHGKEPDSLVEELNHLAVWAAIDAYGVPDRTRVFELVLAAFGRAGSR
jgi:hypothetical protein